jgi:hypothetical protein
MIGRSGSELTVGTISTANLHTGLVFAEASDGLSRAQTIMLRRGFSQLPVLGAQEDSVVSWRSIASASIAGSPTLVRDALEKASTCSADDDLLGVIPTIIERDYVLVRANGKGVIGIVTAADLAEEFDSLARPFLVTGQCEQLIRELARTRIDAEVLRRFSPSYAKSDPDPTLRMTLGNVKDAFHGAENWEALGLHLDQTEFLKWVDDVRKLRNEVAHFRERSADFAEKLYEATNLARYLRSLDASEKAVINDVGRLDGTMPAL